MNGRVTEKAVLEKFRRYFLTAGSAAVVDVIVFAALVAAGTVVAPAAALSFGVAACANYLLTSRFVYGAAFAWRRFAAFLSSAVIGFAINVSVTIAALWTLGVPPATAKFCGVGSAFVINFAMVNFIVYSRERL
jgi:putative flippase GtrA